MLRLLLLFIASMAGNRKRLGADDPSGCDIPKVFSKLSQASATRTGLADTLSILYDEGLLHEDVLQGSSTANLRRKINEGMKLHATAKTPYGQVMQTMDLGAPGKGKWEFCHPLALIHHLSVISETFSDLMHSLYQPGRPFRIVIYVDACDPANPLRFDRTRKIECVYWCFADWPQHVLCRTGAWFVFGLLRTKIVQSMPGGHSEMMARVLETFFNGDPNVHSFTRGVSICHRGAQFMFKAVFGGFLADDEALSFLGCLKGAGGIKICNKCANTTSIAPEHLDDYLVDVACSDPTKFDPLTNEKVYAMHDELKAFWVGGDKTEYERRSKLYGLKYMPGSLLDRPSLRDIYRPVDHSLCDWMHMLVSCGVVGTHLGLLLQVLISVSIGLETVNEFVSSFTLPRKHGKVDTAWLAPRRLQDDTLQSMAGALLTITPIILAFMHDHIAPHGMLGDHILCLETLVSIIGILCMGSDNAMKHLEALQEYIILHAQLFVVLYPLAAKPKFHHLLHLVECATFVGKLLSCFTCERNHRTIRSAALHVFRHLETTALQDVLNRRCSQMATSANLFAESFLIGATEVTAGRGRGLNRSNSCVIACGQIYIKDVIWIEGDTVAQVVQCWSGPSREIVFECDVLAPVDASQPEVVSETDKRRKFFPSSKVFDACAWAHKSPGILRVLVPLGARAPRRA